jgi:protein-disulfide isomerase
MLDIHLASTNNTGEGVEMFKKMSGLVLIATMLFVTACSPSGSGLTSSSPNTVLATVDGEKITEANVTEKIKAQIAKLNTNLYNLKIAGLNQVIEEKLVEKKAKKEGKTSEIFLTEYFAANVAQPTEEEVKKFYDLRKTRMGDKSFDEVKKSVSDFLATNQRNAATNKLIAELKKDATIDIKLQPPRIEIDLGDSPFVGPENAPVTIIEFSDYQCPFCGRSRPAVKKIQETYPEQVKFVFKDYPLSFHKDAQKAHEAAHCAADEGKYWAMYELLFANQKALKPANLKKYAADLGLNTEQFNKCLDESKYASKVAKGIVEARAAGVTGTPAFFVNGILISGARPFEDFKKLIDSELAGKK